jgi:hypothetical protein
MSSTTSEGRHRRVPSGVTTIGRLIRIGWMSIASISASSDRLASSRRSSANGVPFSRSNARTGRPIASMRPRSVARSGGVFRYSITRGSAPLLRISASVLRELPQSGLW